MREVKGKTKEEGRKGRIKLREENKRSENE